MISIDTFVEIGETHDICQDYVISGIEPFPYVIISDGCSSSKDTDVGARLLALSAREFLTHPKDYFINYFNNETCNGEYLDDLYSKMGLCIINKAFSFTKIMSLDIECLDATLIVSFVIDSKVYVYMYGDGNIVIKNDDKIRYINSNFPSSAPFYLSYYLSPERKKLYFDSFEDTKIIRDIDIGGIELVETGGCIRPITFRFSVYDKSTYLIGSDGIESFISGGVKRDTNNLIQPMMGFKNFNGKFIKRRFKRFLLNMNKEGISHFDDISVGGFHFKEE